MALLLAVILGTTAAIVNNTYPSAKVDWTPAHRTVDGLTCVAQAEGDRMVLFTKEGEVEFVPGVNLGSTTPGFQPGEVRFEREHFRTWFPQMARLGLHVLRIYTILPPFFYEELHAYNTANPKKAIYIVHGVWIPEDEFMETKDLFHPSVRDGFKAEITDVVSAIHGTLEREPMRGHASGVWTADISDWVYGYSIGVEWDPMTTYESDEKNVGCDPYHGTYFSSKEGASPTETWIAEMLDFTATTEAALGRTMPLTFTNWPTVDPLEHPEEPLEREELVGVDANNIAVHDTWPGGYFASYHAYPYYPDFQRHEPGLQETFYNGVSDPYAGYLTALREYHADLPVMITEFGVPSAMALAHTGPLGRDQGGHSEQDMMRIDAEMMHIIHDLGFAGGCIFMWADEWFKFTWNTIDYELPTDRRQQWVNPWTNEEHFGLISMEPGPGPLPVALIDGKGDEWEKNESQVIFEGPEGLREVRAVKDEGFLYLRLILDEPKVWKKEPITIGIDVIEGGNGGLPDLPGVHPEADYAIVLGPGKEGQSYVRASNDQFDILWGRLKEYTPYDEAALQEGSGVWNPYRLITNKPQIIPSTGERFPAEYINAGVMRYGTSNPKKKDFDSRAVWCVDKCVEIRLPYMAIGFSDPSSLQALRVHIDGDLTTETVDRVGISVSIGSDSYMTNGYAWEMWQKVEWHQRLKAGHRVLAAANAEVTRVFEPDPPEETIR
jgi:hypothetical protein